MAAGDRPSEGPAFADEMLLADELVEAAWTHPGGQRLALGRGLEERLGAGTGESARWHATDGSVPRVAVT